MYKPEEVTWRTHWDAAAEKMWHAADVPHLIREIGGGWKPTAPGTPTIYAPPSWAKPFTESPCFGRQTHSEHSIIHKSSNMCVLNELAMSSCSLSHTHMHTLFSECIQQMRHPDYIVCFAWSCCKWLHSCKRNDTLFCNYLVGFKPEGCWD